jgi:hypothetical protein
MAHIMVNLIILYVVLAQQAVFAFRGASELLSVETTFGGGGIRSIVPLEFQMLFSVSTILHQLVKYD